MAVNLRFLLIHNIQHVSVSVGCLGKSVLVFALCPVDEICCQNKILILHVAFWFVLVLPQQERAQRRWTLILLQYIMELALKISRL